MKTFDVQSIGIEAPRSRVFDFVAEPGNLPKWANAFKSADNRSARLQTPQGTAAIALRMDARMLANRTDAEDATQEILIKVVTHLGDVRDVQAAGAWAFRIACRHHPRQEARAGGSPTLYLPGFRRRSRQWTGAVAGRVHAGP